MSQGLRVEKHRKGYFPVATRKLGIGGWAGEERGRENRERKKGKREGERGKGERKEKEAGSQ